MRRALTTWSVILGVVILTFVGAVVVLNSTLYSAHGFVESYLDSLARRDARGALALPGVTVKSGAASDLLSRADIAPITDIHLLSDVSTNVGTHLITYSYTIGSRPGQTAFTVEPSGTTLGLFAAWRFATSPISVVDLTVLHDQRFRVNGQNLASSAAPSAVVKYAVFTPGLYTFDHQSTWLTAAPQVAVVTTSDSTAAVSVDVQASAAFVQRVQQENNKHLDTNCVPQTVLMPTSCPFGEAISDRVVSTPVWTMKKYPVIAIKPGAAVGSWLVASTPASAHLVVRVQSLFDGSVSPFDADVPFSVRYLIMFQSDDSLIIEAQN